MDTARTFHTTSEVSWTGAQVKKQCHPSSQTPMGQQQPYSRVLQQTSTRLTTASQLRGPIHSHRWEKLVPQSLQHPVLPSVTLKEIPVMSTGSHNPGVTGLKWLLFMWLKGKKWKTEGDSPWSIPPPDRHTDWSLRLPACWKMDELKAKAAIQIVGEHPRIWSAHNRRIKLSWLPKTVFRGKKSVLFI